MNGAGVFARFDEREYELLAPAIAAIAEAAEADQLCTALALTDGFQFDVVVCPTPRDADALLAWLAIELPDRRGEEVRLHRLRPDRGGGDDRLAPTALTEGILSRLLDDQDRPAKAVVVVDATGYRSDEDDSWRWLFRRWNERRDRIIAAVAAPLLLLLPPELDAALAAEAPDLWSIRSVSVRLPAGEVGLGRNVDYSGRPFEPGAVERIRRTVAVLRGSGTTPPLALAQALRRLAEQELASGHVAEATAAVHALTQLYPAVRDSLELAKIDRVRATSLMASGHTAEAAELLRDRVLPIMEHEGSAYQRALAYRTMAHAMASIGDLAAALRYLEARVLPLDEQMNDDHGRAETLGEIADIHAQRGDLDAALRLRRQVLPVYERLGDVRSRAITAGKIADILFAQGQHDEALRIWREDSLPVFEQLGDQLSAAVTRAKIADVLLARGQIDSAIEIWREVLPVFKQLGDIRSGAITAGKLAELLYVRGEYAEALRLRREDELPAYRQLGDVRAEAATLGGIADLLLARGEGKEALRVREHEVLPIYRRLDDRYGEAMTKGKMADILRALGRVDEALRVRQSEELPIYQELGSTRAEAAVRAEIADMLFSRGRMSESRGFQDVSLLAYEQLRDARARAVTQAKIAEIFEALGSREEALRILQQEVLPILDRLGDAASKAHMEARIAGLLAARPRRGDAPVPQNARYHVLLVGIDAYDRRPLHGCVRDIDAIQRVWLGPRVGVTPDRIRRLASPHDSAGHDAAVPARPATLANLRAALAALGSEAVSADDRVFIYYSGHGSRVAVTAEGRTYFREALAPVDAFADRSDPRLLFDFEVNALLAAILVRTPNVTCVLDCCFTEIVQRGSDSLITRFLRPPEGQGWHDPLPDPVGSRRGDVDEVRPLGRGVDSFQVVVACAAHEMAREDRDRDGMHHGLFSRALVGALDGVPDADLRTVAWNQVWQTICAEVLQRSPEQHPEMSGNAGRAVLAGVPVNWDRGLPVIRTDHVYRIAAGTLAGITPGAMVAIYGDEPAFFPPLDSEADRAARLGVVRVVDAGHASATAHVADALFSLPPGARGRLIRAGAPPRLRCAIVPHDAALAAQIAASPLLELVEPARAFVQLELHGGRWFLTDDVHRAQPGPVLFALEPAELAYARPLLEHYYAYAKPIRMATHTMDLSGGLELAVLTVPLDRLGPASAQQALPRASMGPSGAYELRAGSRVCFVVRNHSRRYLHVTLVNSASSGRVQLLGDQVIDGNAPYVFWAGNSLGVPFTMFLPQGSARGIDRLIAIGRTAMETDLDHLRVDRTFAETVRRDRGGEGGGAWTADSALADAHLEQWTAAHVIIDTRAR